MGTAMYWNEAYCLTLGYIVFLCGWIGAFVLFLLYFQVMVDCGLSSMINESCSVELLWTFVPTAAITVLCCFNVVCSSDIEFWSLPREIIKVTGHQWYWEVEQECRRGELLCYDSLMTDFVSSVDKTILIEPAKPYQLLVTSCDVGHSLSCLDLGFKVDAYPGRVNSVPVMTESVGFFVGYCAELCGVGHAFMPIVFECAKQRSF